MQKLSGKLLSLLALVEIVLGWTGWAIIKSLYPQEAFSWYPYVPCVFFAMGASMIWILAKNYKKDGKKLVNLYMILKLVKLVFAMAYVLGFYFIVKNNIRVFGFVFAGFYASYIALETYIFFTVEKFIKLQGTNNGTNSVEK
ncbi:MAG: hypothetical protein WCL70_07740 [Paludibacter sp.]